VETELMRAQRLESLSLLAAGLSHDLRNILQPLLIMPDLLKARTEGSAAAPPGRCHRRVRPPWP
jgi:signal transduction histidine kinase